MQERFLNSNLRKIGITFANLFGVINISDLLIIYLACGAPCGVYFFLQNRKKLSSKKLWLKSFLTVFVWIPYAFNLLHDFATNKSRASQLNEFQSLNKRISKIQKLLLELNFDSSSKMSLFEFREVLERYAGLTMAVNFADMSPNQAEKEVFRVAMRQNIALGANCLHRRNRQRLLFHQTLARRDFLQILAELKLFVSEKEKLRDLAIEFVEMLKDFQAQESLVEIFNQTLQSSGDFNVQSLENEVWKSKEHKPLPASQMPNHLQALTATGTSRQD
jgi:hypothetical protein